MKRPALKALHQTAKAARAAHFLRRHQVMLVPVAITGLFGLLVLVLGPISYWATVGESSLQGKEKTDAINATRQTLLAAVGGSAVLAGLAFTARTYFLSRRGQLTDRYAKAITMLASDQTTERLGGIYALARIFRAGEGLAPRRGVGGSVTSFCVQGRRVWPFVDWGVAGFHVSGGGACW